MNVLITGANRGIGLEFTHQFLKEGWNVIATARESSQQTDLIELMKKYENKLKVIHLDVTNQESRQKLLESFTEEHDKLDILINNAGIVSGLEDYQNIVDAKKIRLGSLYKENMTKVFETNAIAPLLITELLMNHLKKSENGKVINISAKMGTFAHKEFGGYYSYSASKTALNMFTKTLAADLKRYKITVIALYPDWVRTRMGSEKARLSPDESVKKMIQTIMNVELTQTGQFLDLEGKKLAW